MGIIGKLVRVEGVKESALDEYKKEYEAEVLAIKTVEDQNGTYVVLVLLENNIEDVEKDLNITVERISKCKKIQKL